MSEKTSYGKKYFEFNLIPPKTQEEIIALVERDNTLLYSVILVVFGMILFFATTLIRIILVEPNLEIVKRNQVVVENQINEFNEIKKLNGELFIKARALDPILDKDVEVTKILELEANIKNQFPNLIEINDYSRESGGQFSISFVINDVNRIDEILEFLNSKENVEDVFVKSLSFVDSTFTGATANLSFTLKNI